MNAHAELAHRIIMWNGELKTTEERRALTLCAQKMRAAFNGIGFGDREERVEAVVVALEAVRKSPKRDAFLAELEVVLASLRSAQESIASAAQNAAAFGETRSAIEAKEYRRAEREITRVTHPDMHAALARRVPDVVAKVTSRRGVVFVRQDGVVEVEAYDPERFEGGVFYASHRSPLAAFDHAKTRALDEPVEFGDPSPRDLAYRDFQIWCVQEGRKTLDDLALVADVPTLGDRCKPGHDFARTAQHNITHTIQGDAVHWPTLERFGVEPIVELSLYTIERGAPDRTRNGTKLYVFRVGDEVFELLWSPRARVRVPYERVCSRLFGDAEEYVPAWIDDPRVEHVRFFTRVFDAPVREVVEE